MARIIRGLASKAIFAGCSVIAGTWFYGQQRAQNSTPAPKTVAEKTEQAEKTKSKHSHSAKTASTSASHGTIRDAIAHLVEENNGGLFPKGTRLQRVTLKEGVATLDFSNQFQAIQDSGESSEAEVQRALRKTLAGFPSVQQMRVTVEGHGFESQATDWGKPFDVRDTNALR